MSITLGCSGLLVDMDICLGMGRGSWGKELTAVWIPSGNSIQQLGYDLFTHINITCRKEMRGKAIMTPKFWFIIVHLLSHWRWMIFYSSKAGHLVSSDRYLARGQAGDARPCAGWELWLGEATAGHPLPSPLRQLQDISHRPGNPALPEWPALPRWI